MAGQYIEPMPLPALAEVFALPSQCAVCRSWSRARLCESCMQRFAAPTSRCRRCAIGVPAGVEVCGACLLHPPPFDAALAAVDYAYPWDMLVQRLKFHAALDLASALAALLRDAVRRCAEAPLPALLLPVPLSGARLRERGFNQSWEIARRMSRELGCAADAQLLLRMKDTAHQIALPHDQRAANVRGAFAVEPRRRRELQGRVVAIVDDVMTTGATAAEIATVLLQAGARSVQVWVVARTPLPRSGGAG
jgi:ComF family protein